MACGSSKVGETKIEELLAQSRSQLQPLHGVVEDDMAQHSRHDGRGRGQMSALGRSFALLLSLQWLLCFRPLVIRSSNHPFHANDKQKRVAVQSHQLQHSNIHLHSST